MGCSIKKLDAINNGVMLSLKFYIFYWMVVVIHILSLKECIVLFLVEGGSEFSIYEIELRKMTTHFEILTPKFLWKIFFRITNSTL